MTKPIALLICASALVTSGLCLWNIARNPLVDPVSNPLSEAEKAKRVAEMASLEAREDGWFVTRDGKEVKVFEREIKPPLHIYRWVKADADLPPVVDVNSAAFPTRSLSGPKHLLAPLSDETFKIDSSSN